MDFRLLIFEVIHYFPDLELYFLLQMTTQYTAIESQYYFFDGHYITIQGLEYLDKDFDNVRPLHFVTEHAYNYVRLTRPVPS